MDELNQGISFGGESVTFGDDIDAGDGQDDMMAQMMGAIDTDPYAIGQGLIPQVNDPMAQAFADAAANDPYGIGQDLGL